MIISSLCVCNESSNSRESVVFLSSLSQDVVTSFTVRMSRCCKGEILQADGKKVLDKTAGLHLFSRLQLIASLTGETMKCEERLKLILWFTHSCVSNAAMAQDGQSCRAPWMRCRDWGIIRASGLWVERYTIAWARFSSSHGFCVELRGVKCFPPAADRGRRLLYRQHTGGWRTAGEAVRQKEGNVCPHGREKEDMVRLECLSFICEWVRESRSVVNEGGVWAEREIMM